MVIFLVSRILIYWLVGWNLDRCFGHEISNFDWLLSLNLIISHREYMITNHHKIRFIFPLTCTKINQIPLLSNNLSSNRLVLKPTVSILTILVVCMWSGLAAFDIYIMLPMRKHFSYMVYYQFLLFLPTVGQGLFDYLFYSGSAFYFFRLLCSLEF